MAKAKPERHGEAILRAALAEYRRCEALHSEGWRRAETTSVNAMTCASAFLWHAVLQAHGMGQDEIPASPIGVEVDGVMIIIDPDDGLECGLTVHVIERSNVVRFGRDEEPKSRVFKNEDSGATPFRSHVISGFRTPRTPAELLELIRVVLDACTPLLAYPGDDANELEISFENGRLATIRVEPE